MYFRVRSMKFLQHLTLDKIGTWRKIYYILHKLKKKSFEE